MKVGIKKTLSSNVKEMKKTDRGKAQVDLTNLFNISEKQVEGLVNHFDCDSAGGSKSIIELDVDESIAKKAPASETSKIEVKLSFFLVI